MIGKLTGVVSHRGVDHVMLEVAGVGYLVYCNDRTLASLPGQGEKVALFTDLLVREDLLQLFGFTTMIEKEWHKLLMGVQGIGAKASMAILGALGPDGVQRAISLGDWNAIRAAKGVGPKTAQKVVIELKDKAPAVMAMGGTLPQAMGDASVEVIEPVSTTPQGADGAAQSDALSALVNLGYAHGDAASAVAQAASETTETAALIRAALKLLAPKD